MASDSRSNVYAGVHKPTGAVDKDGYLTRQDGETKPPAMQVDIRPVTPDDRKSFEAMYEQMFRFYKDRNGKVSTPDEVAAAFDATWKQFGNDQSLGIIATATQNHPELNVKAGDIVGFTHAMKSLDPVSGKVDVQVEGTWVPNDTPANLRDRGIGRKLVESVAFHSKKQWDAAGVRWWTLGGKHAGGPPDQGPNPNTKFYDSVQNPDGRPRRNLAGDPVETNRTDERVFNIALTENAAKTYGTKREEAGPVDKTISVRGATDQDAAIWQKIYAEDLQQKGYRDQAFINAALANLGNQRNDADKHLYVIEQDHKVVGVSLVRDGIKLPRDTFTFADILALKFKDGMRVGPAMVNSALQGMANVALVKGSEFARITFPSNHPLIDSIDKASFTLNTGITVGPTMCPHKLYRLPTSAAENYMAHIPEHSEKSRQR